MSTYTTREKHKHNLEYAIDSEALTFTVSLMAEICREKAEHIRENWQDEKLARIWDRNAAQLEKLSPRLYS